MIAKNVQPGLLTGAGPAAFSRHMARRPTIVVLQTGLTSGLWVATHQP